MKTVLVDLDGTLFNIDHRLHFLDEKDYDGFFAAVPDDTPQQWCVDLVSALIGDGIEVIFVSGRNEIARDDTIEQLRKLGFEGLELHMRPRKDFREDYLIKEEIFDQHLAGKNILFVVDDRKQVVDMWRKKKGLVVLHCDEGDF